MNFHGLSVKIIFDKIIQECTDKDKSFLITSLVDISEKINKKIVTDLDIDKLKSLISFLGERINEDIVLLIKNFGNKKFWVSKFLRIVSEISMIGKDINGVEYSKLNMIINETDKMLTETVYKQNLEITDDLYLLSVSILNSDNDSDILDRIKTIYSSLPENNNSLIFHFIKSFEKMKDGNSTIVNRFLIDFVNFVGITKSLFGIKRCEDNIEIIEKEIGSSENTTKEETTKEDPTKEETIKDIEEIKSDVDIPVIETVIPIKSNSDSQLVEEEIYKIAKDEENYQKILRIINKYKR